MSSMYARDEYLLRSSSAVSVAGSGGAHLPPRVVALWEEQHRLWWWCMDDRAAEARMIGIMVDNS